MRSIIKLTLMCLKKIGGFLEYLFRPEPRHYIYDKSLEEMRDQARIYSYHGRHGWWL